MKMLEYIVGECDCCGRPLRWNEDAERDSNGKLVCASCADEHYTRCAHCDELVPKDDVRYVSDYGDVCDSCIDGGDFVQCYDCDKWIHADDSYTRGDEYFCSDCEPEWFECADCGRLERYRNGTTIHNGDIVCLSCADENYRECARCGEWHHIDDMHYSEYADEWFCEDCWDEDEDPTGLMDYHDFPKCDYEPRYVSDEVAKLLSFSSKKRNGIHTFGVELEADCGSFDADEFLDWTEDGSLIHFERDGSLSHRGVECITMPCSLRFHQRKMNWKGILETLRGQGFKSHNTSCCGLHVHIGRDNLKPSTIVKMDVFINRAGAFFSQIARRDVFYSSRYVPDKRIDRSKGVDAYGLHGERYTAVNTTNSNTVEIRIFKGTLKEETVLGTIELCHALIGFLDGLPVTRIYETQKNVLRFVEFCGQNSELYPHLLPMMKRLVNEGDCVSAINHWAGVAEKKAAKAAKNEMERRMKKCA